MKYYLIFLILSFITCAAGQSEEQRIQQAITEINSLLSTYNDGSFSVWEFGDIIDADSVKGYPEIFYPNNTLSECFIFFASSSGLERVRFSIGVFKQNTILWMSEPIFGSFADGSFVIVADLNRNNSPEIVVAYSYGQRLQYEVWWIYSWDGVNGQAINAINAQGNSLIVMNVQSYNFVDINGDGILEIIGRQEKLYPDNGYTDIVFEWNGIEYSKSLTMPYIDDQKFTIANNLNVVLTSFVSKDSIGNLIYRYKIHNFFDSNQIVSSINIKVCTDSFKTYAPAMWYGGKISEASLASFGLEKVFVWPLYLFEDQPYLIGKDKYLDSIIISSISLPKITSYYVQGLHSLVDTSNNIEDNYILTRNIEDILNNSVSGNTIGPGDIINPFVPLDFLDTLLNYNTRSFELGWITNQTTADKYDSLFTSAKTKLQQNNNSEAKTTLQKVLQAVDVDSTNNLTSEAYALLRYNTEYLLENIPQSSPNLLVNLKNSLGNQIPASNVKYYDTSWKDAVDNGDGTFTVITTKPTVSVRMFYEGANQTVNNVPAQNNTYTFQTVNAAVQLKNSLGTFIDVGTVQYYAEAWRSFGTTVNGVANKELLPINYSFRMTYEYGNIDKQQDISVNPSVVFQTINAAVELRNSLGNLIDQGTVQYYAGAWRTFGTTVNGVAYKELLPKNYNFRMTYEYVPIDKQQDLNTNSIVTFSTVLCTVKVINANNQPLEGANTKYYSVSWRDIGLTNTSGIATKELLPKNLSFRAISGSVTQDKQQDIGTNSVVEIQLNVP